MRCSTLADELDEPMAGTVDQRRRWLLVEDRSAWGEKAVRDVLGAPFEAAAKERGVRALLVRRREGSPQTDDPRRVFLVDTEAGEIATRTILDPGELVVDGLADAPLATFGAPVPGPIFLVCTNGRRDACCALRGRAALAALAAIDADAAWECTHLGGHRFAGNLVCLPDGIVYGRVTAADAPRLAAAYRDGRVDSELLRGRSPLPASAQVAEIELRRRLGLDRVRDLELVEAAEGVDEASATFRTPDGRTHRLELRAERLGPARAISCRADALEEPLHWRVAGTNGTEGFAGEATNGGLTAS
jgi:hypothetical protein